jgi:hypothetical protein
VEFVFRLRLLAEMGRLSEHLANQGKRKYDDKKLGFLIRTHELARRWLDEQLDLHTNRPTEFLHQCASIAYPGLQAGDDQEEDTQSSGAFRQELRSALAAEDLVLPNSGRQVAWKKYVSGLIWYYVHMNFDLFSTVAWQEGGSIKDLYLLESREWWDVATAEPQLIENCFSAIDNYPAGTYSLLRIMMSYHFGLLHAQQGVKLQQAILLSSARSGATYMGAESERRQAESLVCAGAIGLRKAIEIGEELKRAEDRDNTPANKALAPTIEPWMTQARTILTSVAQQRIDCA